MLKRMNRTYKNTAANLISRGWTMVANYVFVPVYISILGEEAYGLITFFATLQTALNLLGLGLSKTLRREFASDESSGKDILYKYRILRSVELIYGIISCLICCLCFFGADFIANKYLVVKEIPIGTVILTIRLMGLSIAAQLLANLYLGCLFGQDRQILANIVQIIWSVLKNAGVIIIVRFISSQVSSFYIWHVIIDILYLIVLRYFVINSLKKTRKLQWELKDVGIIKGILRFTTGIMIISIGFTINTQADKMIISANFPLTTVGAYNSAYNLGLIASVFVASMGIAVFPKFTNCYTAGKYEEQKEEYVKVNRLSNIITAVVGSYVAVFSYELLLLWTGSINIAESMQYAGLPLIIGTMFNAFQEIPYNFYLATGRTLPNNIQTACSLLYVLIVTPILIRSLGILGAALSWMIQMVVFTTIYLVFFYKKYFKGEIIKRLIVDTFLPAIISLGFAYCIHLFTSYMKISAIVSLVIAIVSGIVTLLIFLMLYQGMGFFKKEKGSITKSV